MGLKVYNYFCKRCAYNFELLREFDEREKGGTCTECGKRQCPYTLDRSRNRTQTPGPKTHVTDGDGAKNRDDLYKANRWHDTEVRNTAAAIEGKTGVSPYSQMTINPEELEKQGRAKRVSDTEAREKRKRAEKISQKAAAQLTGRERDHALRGSGNSGQR